MPIIWGLTGEQQAMSARPLAAEYARSYYHERKQLRLCVQSCGRMAEAGRTRCDVCLRKARIRWKALHPVFCGECKLPIKSEERSGRRLHKLCAQKRQALRFPSQHRSAALAYQRRHKEMGICLTCPQKVFRAGYCRKHYRMAQERYHRAANTMREAREQGRGLGVKAHSSQFR